MSQFTSKASVLITGGTSGLGLQTAAQLARNWHVVITGRDGARAQAAAARVGAQGLALELGSLADIRRFVDEFATREQPPLRAIICNGGLQLLGPPAFSRDGYEQTFAVNHLGHFHLVTLLLEQLHTPARVVIVASDTHDPTKHTGMPEPRYTSAANLAHPNAAWAGDDTLSLAGKRRYTTSKLCNVLFAYEAQRRLGGNGVTFNAFDPGMMPGTGLARDYPAYQRLAWRYLLPALTLARRNVHTPQQSARALARMIADPALQDVGGRYYSGMREISSSAQSQDLALAAELWDGSVALVQ